MAWVKNADEVAFFRACEGGSTSNGELGRRGCEPVLDIEAPEKPGRTVQAKRARARPAKINDRINCSFGINVAKCNLSLLKVKPTGLSYS